MIEKISLNALKFFYFTATFGSVTAAAQRLFVTQSAVSKQVRNLEDTLGYKVFDRVNKSLILTIQGEALFLCCQQVFTQLDSCLLGLKQSTIENKQLILSCEPTLSMKWLIPRLASFNQLDYGFEICLLTAGGAVDFTSQHIDIALRRNDFKWGVDIYSKKIIDEYIVAVTSPQAKPNNTLLVSSSRPNFRRNLFRYSLKPSSGQSLYSPLFEALDTDKPVGAYDEMILEHFYLCIEACLAGLGTTILSIYMIEKEVKNRLFNMTSPPIADGSAYHLLSPSPFVEDRRKTIFANWLKSEMLKTQAYFLSKTKELC